MEGVFRCDCELEGPGKPKTSCTCNLRELWSLHCVLNSIGHHGISDAEYNFLIDHLPCYLTTLEDKSKSAMSRFLIGLRAEFLEKFPEHAVGSQDVLQWCIVRCPSSFDTCLTVD